jgi:hypothetical protein
MRYTQDVLRERYPDLARVFETVIESNAAVGSRLRYLYYPGYRTSSRKDKILSLQRIIEEVEAAGYNIDIKAFSNDAYIPSI